MRTATVTLTVSVLIALVITGEWALFVYSQGVTQAGYLVVAAAAGSPAPVGAALFSYSSNEGVLVSQAGVASAEPIRAGRIFVDEAGAHTGLVLVNASGNIASAVLILRDANGNEVNRQPRVLSAGQHLSRYIRQLFSDIPPAFVGSLTFESDSPLAAVTLRESLNSRGEPLYTTLPVVDLAAASNDPVVFPHIAAGQGYTTQLLLTNRSGQRIRGQIRLIASDGLPLLLQMTGSTVSEFTYQIEPNSVYRAELENPSGLSVGFALAVPEAGSSAPAGTAIFQFKTTGQIVTEAGVAATSQTTVARIFVDETAGQTGLAIANPGNEIATLNLDLMDRYGGIESTTTLTIPAGGHRAAFLTQFFTGLTEGFTGLVEIRSTAPVATITLRLTVNKRNETILTTLPVADPTRQAAATTVIFPQVAFGGGFSTRLIFIHPDRTNSAVGRMQFYRDDGVPMVIPMGGLQSSLFDYRFSPGSARQFLPGNTATVASITLLDASNQPTTELTINEGTIARPRVRITDNTGAFRDDFDVDYRSSNPDVASTGDGVVLGKVRGFSTVAISAGGVVKAVVATVTGIGSGVLGFEPTHIAQNPAQQELYLAATGQHTVLLAESVTQTPEIFAGTPRTPGLKNDLRLMSEFRSPAFLSINHSDRNGGSLYVSDAANNVIRRIQLGQGGRVDTLAGTGLPGSVDGLAEDATFRNPQGIALDDQGQLWVSDSDNHTIRRINLSAKRVDTIAGDAGRPGLADGRGQAARFNSPAGITVEPEPVARKLERLRLKQPPPPIHVIVADSGNNAIRRVYEDGRVETLGAPSPGALSIGSIEDRKSVSQNRLTIASLLLSAPADVAADPFGTIYVTEPGAKQVRAILPNGDVVAVAGANTFSNPKGIVVTRNGRIVVADTGLREIRYGEPQITSITPDRVSARGNVKITIRGRNFAPGTFIVADDVVMTNVNAAESDTETISLVTPPLPSGRTTLTVQNRGGLAQTALLVDSVRLNDLPMGYITTVAGGSTYAGDGGSASAAPVTPSSIALDPNGNLLVADPINHRIRRVDARSGVITFIAGNGLYSFSGDGGLAITAGLNTPLGIAVDGAGNLYIADSYNLRVRRVDARTGKISTVAGTGVDGFRGDGGPAAAADLNLPTGLAIDAGGNLFVADTLNNRIRRVDTAGTITTVAGDGQARFAGDNGPGRNASLNRPDGIAVDSEGSLLIADSGNNRVRRLDKNGIITTVAGNGQYGFSGDGTLAQAAQLAGPSGIALDADGNFFIADAGNCRIRRVAAADSRITTVAGDGSCMFYGDAGPARAAAVNQPRAVATDTAGNIFIADLNNRRVRRVDVRTGIISTVAGNGEGAFLGENGPATLAVINYPLALAFDSSGSLFIGDSDNRIRKVDMNTGVITIVAGGGGPPDGIGDGGLATEAAVWSPWGIAFDRAGNLYIGDNGHARARKVDVRTNVISTIAGTGQEGFSGDGGFAVNAALNSPRSLAIDANGNLFISDEDNVRIRKVNLATGTITTFAGNGTRGFSGDGGPAHLASLSTVWNFVMDPAGNIYIADYYNARVRRVDGVTGVISTVAGGGRLDSNGILATDAEIAPISLAFDGRLFIMDLVRQGISRIDQSGIMNLVVGNADRHSGFSGDNGPASAASLTYPASMAFDRLGNLFIADSNNNRIRAVRGPIP